MIAPAQATVVRVYSASVTIACPYCGVNHNHARERRRVGRFHHSPMCGLERSGDQRAAGYTFTLTEGD